MGQVRRTPQVRADLKAIARYMARESHNLDTALRFLDAFAHKSTQYAREPQLGEARPGLGMDVRQFVLGSYVAYYRPTKNGIELLRVLHGSRDIRGAWRPNS